MVRMPGKVAGSVWIRAGEHCLRFAIVFGAVPTARAGATGVARVHQHDGYPRPRRFVGDVLPQLEESPRMPLVAIGPANRCPLSYPTQVFEGECLAGDEGFVDELLADTVVGVFLKAGFA